MMVLIVSLIVVLSGSRSAAHEPGSLSGPPGERLGTVTFPISCQTALQQPFERAVALLHSFWYFEALKAFTAVTQADPDCAMSYWGVAMSLWYQIWSPPSPAALQRGWEAVEQAKMASTMTPRERDYIAAAEAFFKDWNTRDHRTRTMAYEQAMEQVSRQYPHDLEAAAFYALALQATADPKDKSYAQQRKSSAIAEQIVATAPDHPGAVHYLIHAYDYPTLATRGLAAAQRYAQFAPSVPHALHMPSHIYVLLGMWPETIQSNLAAAAAEQQRGNPDDHLHALDYLIYAYLQQAQDHEAQRVLDEGRGIVAELATRHYDSGRATAHFAIAAMEARWAMERERWAEAAALAPRPNKFPHTEAMIFFARAIGAARTGSTPQARADAAQLARLREALRQAQNGYWAEQVDIQHRAATAWVLHAEGQGDEALAMMRAAAELEESTEKHNITPGPIALARELLGDMLMELRQPAQALREYETALRAAPNRFKALHGVAKAAALGGDHETAGRYYGKLVDLAAQDASARPALQDARAFLGTASK
jgi:tetratricopeptide (TPR) repeat protein